MTRTKTTKATIKAQDLDWIIEYTLEDGSTISPQIPYMTISSARREARRQAEFEGVSIPVEVVR